MATNQEKKEEQIIELLRQYRFSLEDEKKLQKEFAKVLDNAGYSYHREYRLDSNNIIDFLLDGIGIEFKIKGSKRNIFRQLERYSKFQEIDRLILATNVAMGKPELENGKPLHYFKLSVAWL